MATPRQALEHDELSVARKHLEIIIRHAPPSSFIELRALSRSHSGPDDESMSPAGSHFVPTTAAKVELEAAIMWAENQARRGAELFVGYIARAREGGKKVDVQQVSACYADLDLYGEGLEAAHEAARMAPTPPSLIVLSGYGLHLVWFIAPTPDKALWAQVQEMIYQHFASHGADRAVVADESRVLRLVPFPNLKRGDRRLTKIVEHKDAHVSLTIDAVAQAFRAGAHHDDAGLQVSKKQKGVEVSGAILVEGERNNGLMRLAGVMRQKGMTEEAIKAALLAENKQRCNPQLSECEVERIAASVVRYEPSAWATGADLHGSDHAKVDSCTYDVDDDGYLVRLNPKHGGPHFIRMCNFRAEIVSEIVEDDGATTRRLYEIRGALAGQEHRTTKTVGAEDYNNIRWWETMLGARATVNVGQIEHVRCAVKLLSGNIAEKRVYTHTGWRKIKEDWCYLHGDGAIGRGGNLEDITVRLPDALSPFMLPDPPEGQELKRVIKAHLEALEVASLCATAMLFGSVWAAILGGADFSTHLAGATGAGKTELAALAQSHFGAGFDRDHLPGSWSSTANSLERLAYVAKDALMTVDDFSPKGTTADAARQDRDADRLLRAQGNRAGRLRLNADTSFNQARAPRGLIVSTGEDVPRGLSLRARLVIVEIGEDAGEQSGAVDFDRLTECQKHARDGDYAAAVAAFIKWLAPHYEEVMIGARKEVAQLRAVLPKGSKHKRHATTSAIMTRAWTLFLDFARDSGAIDEHEHKILIERITTALHVVMEKQEAQLTSQDPAKRFLELIKSALGTGMAYLARAEDGREPNTHSAAYGWHGGMSRGRLIGWVDDDKQMVLLDPDAAYNLVNELSGKGGATLGLTQMTLWKRLKERGLLIREDARQSNKMRATIVGQRREVIVIRAEIFV